MKTFILKEFTSGSKLASKKEHADNLVESILSTVEPDEEVEIDLTGIEIIVSHFLSDSLCILIIKDKTFYNRIKFINVPNQFTSDKLMQHRELAYKYIPEIDSN